MAVILIRKRQTLFGGRTIVDLANYGPLEEVMATAAVQEMVTKVWFGGLEPEGRFLPLLSSWLLPPIAPFVIPPANDVHVDFEAPIFSWSTREALDESGGMTKPNELGYWKKLIIFMTVTVIEANLGNLI